jgi:hypothetical protein
VLNKKGEYAGVAMYAAARAPTRCVPRTARRRPRSNRCSRGRRLSTPDKTRENCRPGPTRRASTRTSTDSATSEALRASSLRRPRSSSEAVTAFGETIEQPSHLKVL